MMKFLERVGIQGTFTGIIEAIYSNPLANFKHNSLNTEQSSWCELKAFISTFYSLWCEKGVAWCRSAGYRKRK